MNKFYDRDGKPISIEQWGPLHQDEEYRRVGSTVLPDGKWVSTVWIGIDHSFGLGEAAPLIFETMVFPSEKGDFHELDVKRYITWEEAWKGHWDMVEHWAKKGQLNALSGPS